MRLWASLRDTQGDAFPSAHPIGRLISAYPHLRGMTPAELATHLEVSEREAQAGVTTLAHETFGAAQPVAAGASFDRITMAAGRPAPPVVLRGAGAGMWIAPPAVHGL